MEQIKGHLGSVTLAVPTCSTLDSCIGRPNPRGGLFVKPRMFDSMKGKMHADNNNNRHYNRIIHCVRVRER